MNIHILSDKHEHVCAAIKRSVDLINTYGIKDDSKLLSATKQHYISLLEEELRILKDVKC